MHKYRIVYINGNASDPCHWQAQKRVWIFFWKNICGRTASATTQGNEILKLKEIYINSRVDK